MSLGGEDFYVFERVQAGMEEGMIETEWFGIKGTTRLIPLWKWFESSDRRELLSLHGTVTG